MKRVLLLALVALMSTVTIPAQGSKSPKGLYRLKSFIYEDGRTSIPNFKLLLSAKTQMSKKNPPQCR